MCEMTAARRWQHAPVNHATLRRQAPLWNGTRIRQGHNQSGIWLDQLLEAGADPRRHGRRLARLAIHEDVDEMARCRRLVVPLPEEADLVAHRRVAELSAAQPGVDDLGKRVRQDKLGASCRVRVPAG